MAEGATIDARMGAALARLTDNEKECLRRRLLLQTAKEMALELGVSPHAVEKRLKMARTKLGLSSSLEAARLLAIFEGYQRTGPQPSGLERGPLSEKKRHISQLVFGGIAMSVLAAVLIVFGTSQAPGSGGVAPLDPGGVAPSSSQGTAPKADSNGAATSPALRKASWDETAAFLAEGFAAFDKDKSGYLEPVEASVLEPRDPAFRDRTLPSAPPAGERDPAAEEKWLTKLDNDRDGLVSRHEYVEYMIPWVMWQGIPEDWKGAGASTG